MARITAKSKIKPDGYYTIWFRHKSWPRTGPGSYVIERSFGGRSILYDWDEIKVGQYRGPGGGAGAYFVYPKDEDPTQPKARKKATKRKTTKRRPTTKKSQKTVAVFDEELGGEVKVLAHSTRYVIHPKYDRHDEEIEKFIVKSMTATEAKDARWPTFGARWAAEAQAKRDLESLKEERSSPSAFWADY